MYGTSPLRRLRGVLGRVLRDFALHRDQLLALVAVAVEPRELLAALQLECSDQVDFLHGQADIIQAVDEAMLLERINLERDGSTIRTGDLLRGEIDLDLLMRLRVRHELPDISLGQGDGQHAILEAVAEEDVGEAGRNQTPDAEVVDRPRRVLPGGAAAEVVAADHDFGLAVRLPVQHELGLLRAIHLVPNREEGALAEARALDRLKELLRNDHVGVHVLHVQGRYSALECGELGHAAHYHGTGDHGHLLGKLSREGRRSGHGCRSHELLPTLQNLTLVLGADQFSHVAEPPGDSSGCCHGGADQVRPALKALPTLEVPVGGRGAALLGRELIGVHAQAHGAACLTPLEPCLDEDLVQAFRLCLLLHQAGTGDNVGQRDVVSYLPALSDLGGLPQVFDTGVGARADEDLVHLD
mmetsp:Transcript_63643/g.164250  ORF Transcript_63643/g.164250 Transcript_63643/m.164250 type:complete len:413 (+) Transcript_63643:202-1440(+)